MYNVANCKNLAFEKIVKFQNEKSVENRRLEIQEQIISIIIEIDVR